MDEKLKQLSDYLLLPGAIVALLGGLVSIYKDTVWYIYLPLFFVTAILIVLAVLKKSEMHNFKVLKHTMTLEIKDKMGKETIFTNTARIKSLKKGAQNFDYLLYGDGEIKDIITQQGSVTEIKREGGRLLVKTNIERPLEKGGEVDHTLTAKFIDCFTSNKEFWQTAKNAPGTNIHLVILTVPDRPIKEYQAYKIVGHTKTLLDQQPTRIIIGANSGISLDFDQAKFLEKYRIEWSW